MSRCRSPSWPSVPRKTGEQKEFSVSHWEGCQLLGIHVFTVTKTQGPAAWEDSPFPLHSLRASLWRYGWVVIMNVQSRAELSYWKKLVLEPSVMGRQMFRLSTWARKAADSLPLFSFKYFPSKDPNKEFQNCLIIMDVYQEYQNGEDLQKVLSKYLLKTWSPVSQTESQGHKTLQKSPIWSSVAVFPQLPFFKPELARLVSVSWFAGIEKKCPVNTLLPWSWQQSGLTSKTGPAEKGQETVWSDDKEIISQCWRKVVLFRQRPEGAK